MGHEARGTHTSHTDAILDLQGRFSQLAQQFAAESAVLRAAHDKLAVGLEQAEQRIEALTADRVRLEQRIGAVRGDLRTFLDGSGWQRARWFFLGR